MTNADDRLNDLNALKARRKNGELDVVAYYKGLLGILATTVQHLQDEEIAEAEAKKQVPLILVFLEEQIGKLADRGG
jgi:hypothetical protein